MAPLLVLNERLGRLQHATGQRRAHVLVRQLALLCRRVDGGAILPLAPDLAGDDKQARTGGRPFVRVDGLCESGIEVERRGVAEGWRVPLLERIRAA